MTDALYATPDFQAHWVEEMPEELYHGDKTAVGSSDLRMILDSPKKFQWGFFRGHQRPESEALRLGKIIHMAFLEGQKFLDRHMLMPDFGDMRSSANRAKRDAWKSDLPPGSVVVTQEEHDQILGIIDSIMGHADASRLFKNGRPEVSGYYRDTDTGIRCKIRLDFLTFNGRLFTDLKTARSCDFRKFGSKAFEYRYDIQLAMYMEGARAIGGFDPEVISMVAVEKTWPYECAVYYFMPEDFTQAKSDYRKALTTLDTCLKADHWPARQERMQRIYTPKWFQAESVEDEDLSAFENVGVDE